MKDKVVLEFLWEVLKKDKEDEVSRLVTINTTLETSNKILVSRVEDLENKYKQSYEKVKRLEKELSNLTDIPR